MFATISLYAIMESIHFTIKSSHFKGVHMNILLYDMSSFIQRDLIYYLTREGHHCHNIRYKFKNTYEDPFFQKKFVRLLSEGQYDFVMSTNFYPIIAKLCHDNSIKYVSWIYDSPIDTSKLEYFQFETNYVFMFDRIEAESLSVRGGVHIYHLPLAINTNRLDSIRPSSLQIKQFSSEISFLGSFYENPMNTIMQMQTDYVKGYLDAMIQTQLQLYGVNILSHLATPELVDEMNKNCSPYTKTVLSNKSIINTLEKQISYIERTVLCSLLSEQHQLKYYSSTDQSSLFPKATWMGTAYYFKEMPYVFKCSKLNLNVTLKGIQSGIPLRALDILGCGGALLSNYQLELAEYFADGQDIILYESIEDAIAKADFYLSHPDLTKEIAKSGYQIAKEHFSYPKQLNQLFKTAGLS